MIPGHVYLWAVGVETGPHSATQAGLKLTITPLPGAAMAGVSPGLTQASFK